MVTLETERLILRMWEGRDFDALASMLAEPEVMRFLSADGKPMSRFDAWRSLCANIGHWQLRGFGMFAVLERVTGELVGRIGPWQPEGWPGLEIGWTLRSQYWGRGYATEAVNRCITYAFNELQRTHLISLIDPGNLRSIRVAERVGERLEGTTTLPHLPGDRRVLQYGLRRDDWQESQAVAVTSA
jgi:RimJ/RimL family protein N-acetyltransferase